MDLACAVMQSGREGAGSLDWASVEGPIASQKLAPRCASARI